MASNKGTPTGSSPQNPSPNPSLPRSSLPKDLQNIVDNEESLFDQIYDGTANESTDSNLRYAAYANRLRTILLSAQRYVAYTSDVGESFRPIAHPWLIRSAYGISWAYLIGDVSHEGYKAHIRNQRVLHPGTPGVVALGATDARGNGHNDDTGNKNNSNIGGGKNALMGAIAPPAGADVKVGHVPLVEDYRVVMAQRAVFQSIASMGLPAFTIHSIVRYSGRALKDAKNVRIRTYGPIGLGLAAVPFLPVIFDQPVEEVTEWVFHKAFETFGGPDAVGHASEKGKIQEMESRKGVGRDKEL